MRTLILALFAKVSNLAHGNTIWVRGGTPLPYCGTLPLAEISTVGDSARDVTNLRRGSYVHASSPKKPPRAPAAGSSTIHQPDTPSQGGSRDKQNSSTCKTQKSPRFV